MEAKSEMRVSSDALLELMNSFCSPLKRSKLSLSAMRERRERSSLFKLSISLSSGFSSFNREDRRWKISWYRVKTSAVSDRRIWKIEIKPLVHGEERQPSLSRGASVAVDLENVERAVFTEIEPATNKGSTRSCFTKGHWYLEQSYLL